MTLPLQGSLLQLASGSGGDPPDDAQDPKAIAPFIVKHVPLLRMLEADHRRETVWSQRNTQRRESSMHRLPS